MIPDRHTAVPQRGMRSKILTNIAPQARFDPSLAMQVQIRTNSLEFEFTLSLQEFFDPSEFEFATSNSKFPELPGTDPAVKTNLRT